MGHNKKEKHIYVGIHDAKNYKITNKKKIGNGRERIRRSALCCDPLQDSNDIMTS